MLETGPVQQTLPLLPYTSEAVFLRNMDSIYSKLKPLLEHDFGKGMVKNKTSNNYGN